MDVTLNVVGDHAGFIGANKPELDVVFVHGLNGSHDNTWTNTKESFYWPNALANEFAEKKLRLWSLSYPAAPAQFGKDKNGASLQVGQEVGVAMRAKGISLPNNLPFVFVCHSFGGILVKRMLVEWRMAQLDYHYQCLGVMFIATPHHSVDLARVLNICVNVVGWSWGKVSGYLGGVLGQSTQLPWVSTIVEKIAQWKSPEPSAIVEELSNVPELAKLNTDFSTYYRQRLDEKPLTISLLAEQNTIFGNHIVPEDFADPHLRKSLGAKPLPVLRVNADHLEICKLTKAEGPVWNAAVAFINEVLERKGQIVSLSDCESNKYLFALYWRLKDNKGLIAAMHTKSLGTVLKDNSISAVKYLTTCKSMTDYVAMIGFVRSSLEDAYKLAASEQIDIDVATEIVEFLATSALRENTDGGFEKAEKYWLDIPANHKGEDDQHFHFLLECARAAQALEPVAGNMSDGNFRSQFTLIGERYLSNHTISSKEAVNTALRIANYMQNDLGNSLPKSIPDLTYTPEANDSGLIKEQLRSMNEVGRGLVINPVGQTWFSGDRASAEAALLNELQQTLLGEHTRLLRETSKLAQQTYDERAQLLQALRNFYYARDKLQ
jgi:hypothetical protein